MKFNKDFWNIETWFFLKFELGLVNPFISAGGI